ncbi:hypothetical protein E3N88_37101 [Mikania micrantha]|uniref:Uncharacterized protein n=1 Tax=Mikania micrantha TaxID=192012 RepID=A0A5N6M671_9ASTR|nr:hypothetical protein E3N88_37101 [Mikania micrantha]
MRSILRMEYPSDLADYHGDGGGNLMGNKSWWLFLVLMCVDIINVAAGLHGDASRLGDGGHLAEAIIRTAAYMDNDSILCFIHVGIHVGRCMDWGAFQVDLDVNLWMPFLLHVIGRFGLCMDCMDD